MIRDISTWEIFFVGARTLIGKRTSAQVGTPQMLETLASTAERLRADARPRLSPVFQLERLPSPQGGLQTIVYPVGWFPVQELALPDDAMSVAVKSLGPEEMRGLAKSVEKATELLQQMRAAASGIAVAREMPK